MHILKMQYLTVSSALSEPSPSLLTLLSPFTSIFYYCPPPSSPGTQCGYIIPPIVVSASNTISVTFQSDSRLTDRGFSAKWEAVYPEDIAGTKDTHTCTHIQHTHSHLQEQVYGSSLGITIKHLSHISKASKVQ